MSSSLPDSHTVVYPPGVGAEIWAEGYAKGSRPDPWLYGLNRLRNPASIELAELSAREQFSLIRRSPVRQRSRATVVAWEERLAARAIVRGLASNARLVSGIIWDTDYPQYHPRALVTRRVLQQCDGLWYLSAGQAEAVSHRYGRDVPHIGHIRFGIDVDFFAPQAPPREPQILSLGTDRHRDWRTLAAVLSKVHAARPDARAIVQGAPPGSMPSWVKTVSWFSHTELRDVYAESTVVLLPTDDNLHASGMTAACEAQAMGCSVVATDTPGMSQYLHAGVTGVLVAPRDTQGFTDATLAILDAPSAHVSNRASSTEFARAELNSRRMTQELQEFIDEASQG